MKKCFILFVILMLPLVWLNAQDEGKTITYDFSKASRKINLENLSLSLKGTANEGTLIIKKIKMPLKKNDPFVSFSARLEGTNLTHESVALFIKKNNDKEWLPVPHFSEGEGNDGIWVSNMLELDKTVRKVAVKIEVKNPKTTLSLGRFRFYCPGNVSTGNLEGVGSGGAAGCEVPPSVSRQTWGAAFGLTEKIATGTPTLTTVTHLIVHHSAGSNTSANWAATVAAIFDFHTKTNGWADVGYNWLIAPDGTLFVGRGGGNNVVGAHMCGYNNNTMGVCLLGTYTTVSPPKVAIDKLTALLAWKCIESKIDPTGSAAIRSHTGTMMTISGHRDGCAPAYTECPGDMNHSMLPTLRNNVKTLTTACLTNTKEFSNVAFLKIYPNPNNGIFTLEMRLKKAQAFDILISDTVGRLVFNQKITPSETDFNMPIETQNLANGLYFLSIKNPNQIKTTSFLIKK